MIAVSLAMSALLAVSPIPKNFLITEHDARTPSSGVELGEEWWKISDKIDKKLELNPCGRRGTGSDGRVAMRTITYHATAPLKSSEQLVIYKSPKAAATALARLRADVRKCAEHRRGSRAGWDPNGSYRYVGRAVRLADEALWVREQAYEEHSGWSSYDWFLAARRGAALMIYSADDGAVLGDRSGWKQLSRKARKMSVKVCELPGVCAHRGR